MSTIFLTVPGRVATKPERLSSGNVVGVKFRIASTERRFDRSADAWNDAEPVYLTVTCWRQLAESVLGSLRIGDPVIAHGKLVNSRFERDGRVEYRLEMRADAVGPDLRWSTAVVSRVRAAAAEAPQGVGAEEPGGPRVPAPAPAPDDGAGGHLDGGQHRGVLTGEGAGRA
ncbi:single-stranded DNA-binding protein [Pseudonocardia sichuanensis]|uniref:Single-strand DNA-binding protein n=1 Tax=Pseudonocardia kunmingensis TaxID=630975 RepID=A0A543DZJ6_9PSEU|nr:single-stranded DNA-binding protein [Pseudonocardia kunmingensis]TQM14669.1 single-strand DNA-binding protein [Pseudonocardia kunmingensis]